MAERGERTEFGPAMHYVPKAVGGLVTGTLALGLLAYLATVAASAEVSVGPAVFLFVLLGAGAVMLLVEAGYLGWHWLRRSTLTVDGGGIALRSRRHRIVVPWTEVDQWTVGVGSRWSTSFFMSVRRSPDPRLRRPSRQIVLARPASDVQDPGAGPRKALWSRRRRAWVVCRVAHTNATAAEIVATFRLFAADKEGDDTGVRSCPTT